MAMLTVALLAATLLTNAAEIASAISDGRAKVRFQLDCCTLTMPYSSNCCTFAVEDASGGAILRNEDATT